MLGTILSLFVEFVDNENKEYDQSYPLRFLADRKLTNPKGLKTKSSNYHFTRNLWFISFQLCSSVTFVLYISETTIIHSPASAYNHSFILMLLKNLSTGNETGCQPQKLMAPIFSMLNKLFIFQCPWGEKEVIFCCSLYDFLFFLLNYLPTPPLVPSTALLSFD